MVIDSPVLGLASLMLGIVILWLASTVARFGRWLLRGAVLAAMLAVAGVGVRCDRALKLAVMVDVSPSTRGATFHDPAAVVSRLTPLLAGRPYTLHYFADCMQPTADEPACERTRLNVPADADAVLLMSDGRFDAPAVLPPTFPIVDPALDRPGEARVVDIREAGPVAAGRGAVVQVIGGAGRRLSVVGGSPETLPGYAGPGLFGVTLAGRSLTARFDAGDRWPENDAMTFTPADAPARRLAVGRAAEGCETVARLPADLADYADVSVVVLDTTAEVSPAQADTLGRFVRDLGGMLVLSGPPGRAGPAVRALSPMSATPPAGAGDWVLLLDASGSMAAAAENSAGRTRWAEALAAAGRAVEALPSSARVTVMRFSRDVATVAGPGTPDGVARRLAETAADTQPPSGPTGLRSALTALTAESGSPRHVLLLTDGDAELGDPAALVTALRKAGVTLDAVTPTGTGPLAAVCRATGGRAVTGVAPGAWAAALGGLAADTVEQSRPAGTADGTADLAGAKLAWSSREAVSTKAGAVICAAIGDEPVAAAWGVGAGRVLAVSAVVPDDVAGAVAGRTQRAPNDGRFSMTWEDATGSARCVTNPPQDGISLTLRSNGTAHVFEQVGPGTYTAVYGRSAAPAVATVSDGGRVIARHAIAGRYPAEFDAIGNDRDALARIAVQTGGRVVGPGDNRPLDLPTRTMTRSLRTAATAVAAVLLLAAIFALRRSASA